MFNRMTGAALILALVFSLAAYSFAFAETTGQDYAVLQSLQAKIQELQKMIDVLKAQMRARGTNQSTVDWTDNMKPGQKDAEKLGPVLKLQVLLKKKGYADFAPTGYYGSKTAEAVKRLQQEQGVLPSFKSPGVTDKENYLKKLAEKKIIPSTEAVFGQQPVATGSGRFDPCFDRTGVPQDVLDKCVQEKLGYGVVGPKTTAVLRTLTAVPASAPLSSGTAVSITTADGCRPGDTYSRTTGQTCTATTPGPGGHLECKGDMNQNGAINFDDINLYRDVWEKNQNTVSVSPGQGSGHPLFWYADIDDNSVLNQNDLDLFVGILSGTVQPLCR